MRLPVSSASGAQAWYKSSSVQCSRPDPAPHAPRWRSRWPAFCPRGSSNPRHLWRFHLARAPCLHQTTTAAARRWWASPSPECPQRQTLAQGTAAGSWQVRPAARPADLRSSCSCGTHRRHHLGLKAKHIHHPHAHFAWPCLAGGDGRSGHHAQRRYRWPCCPGSLATPERNTFAVVVRVHRPVFDQASGSALAICCSLMRLASSRLMASGESST